LSAQPERGPEVAARLRAVAPLASDAGSWRRAERGLALLLAASALLRALLVLGGGQGYWPDENRYLKAWGLLLSLSSGDLRGAIESVALSPDHTGFTVLGVVPAAFQASWMALVGLRARPAAIGDASWVAALVLASASLACVALVFGLARRSGAPPGEALAAAGLAAASNTLFYYARHLHPYDLSLAFNLLALWLSLARARGAACSLAVGLAAGAGFWTYNGAWLGSAAAAIVHVLRARGIGDAARSAALCAAGLASWVLLSSLLTWPFTGEPLFFQTARFSELARTQADFSEGASLPFAFLWSAERGIALVYAAGAIGALALVARRAPGAARAGAWLALAVALYAALALFSVGFERIGVFGRQVRQCVPFLCLAAAAAWSGLVPPALRRRTTAPLCAALLAQAAWNFAEPLAQVFPADFVREARARYGALRRGVTLVGPNLRRPAFGGSLPDRAEAWDPAARHVVLNAQHLYPIRGEGRAPAGRETLRARHPMAFRPYQYEGFVPRERAVLRAADLSMRVVELAPEPDSNSSP